MNLILDLLGTPRLETVNRIGSQRARDYINGLPKKAKVPFKQVFPNANTLAIDLLERMLDFDPTQRITVDEALAHPYLAVYHDPNDEPVHQCPFDFQFEELETIESLKACILQEIAFYHPDVNALYYSPQLLDEDTYTQPVSQSPQDYESSPLLRSTHVKSQKRSSESTSSPLDELERDLAYGAQDSQ